MRRFLPAVLPLVLAAPSALPAQSQTGPYTAQSFEAPLFQPGPLGAGDMWSGQDGWMLFEYAYPPNYAAASVQSAVVRSGTQAVKFDASLLTPGSFGELRRNALFNLTSGVLEIELDFLITTASTPSEWEIYSQPAPNPQSCYLRWWIAANGRIEYLDTPNRVLVQTNTFVAKDTWHHARSIVDVAGNRTEIHVDGVLVATGTPIGVWAQLPEHGFTQVNAYGAGNDAIYLDNFTVRERLAPHGLSVDVTRLPKDVHSVLTFRLAGGASLANRPYALAGSMSGTSPGTPLGSVVLPLVVDPFFGMVVSAFGQPHLAGFLGTFNADGNAYATFDTLIPMPAALVGLDLDFAYVTLSPIDAVSETARATVTLQ
ncbi:MAG: hypothetical protein JNK78_15420 [Planctomycetes bacterium]|nr:hypothetical protein [Planctomycetota bacterium]